MIYKAIVTSNILAKSKEKGTPSVEIQVCTVSEQPSGNPVAMTLTGNLWLTPDTADRTTETLAYVFGWAGNSFTELNKPILAGIECEITVEESVFNGRTQKNIAFFNKAGSLGSRTKEPIEDAQARAIASRFDGALRAYKAKGGLVSQVSKATTQNATSQDDALPWE
jgi:hypothetical protein